MSPAPQQTEAAKRLRMGLPPPIQARYHRPWHPTMPSGRYRTRTWLRGRLPYRLTWLAPKGEEDCGGHEWYRYDDNTALCYHCEAGHRELAPVDRVTEAMKVYVEIDGEKQEFELPDEAFEALKQIANRNGLTLQAALQQAIANEKFIEDELRAGGKLLVEKDDKLREVEFA